MKKSVLCLCSILVVFVSQAQHFHFGITSSYNPTKIKGDGMSSTLTPGLTIGTYAEWRMAQRLSLQPEVTYTEKNVVTSDDFKDVYPETSFAFFKQNVSLYYLSVPLLINYHLNDKWKIYMGPQWSYRLNTKEALLRDGQSAFKRRDVGLAAGVQVQLEALKIFGRYVYGIRKINNINDYHSWYSRSIEIGAGWRFL